MPVPTWLWIATIAGLLVLLAVDLVIVDHRPHHVGIREAACWVVFYIACAAIFGIGIWAFFGGRYAGEFFAGYVTEYSLSIDNLFVFVVILGAFAVPKIHQHKVLLIGVVLALVLRGLLILIGAAMIARFGAVFYIFGAFLIFTAYRMVRASSHGEDEEYKENGVIRLVKRALPVTGSYHGAKSFVKFGGRRMVTPMLIVMIAIGTTDLVFALDSIPAIFGLTREPFLVFTANAFALMGLRQLYFLIGGLLRKLVYLPLGLAAILAFVGIKLILDALHGDAVPFMDGRQSIPVPEINIGFSLGFIVVVLVVTTVASLVKSTHEQAVTSRGR